MKHLNLLIVLLFTGFASSAQCVASFTGTQAPTGNNLLNVNFTNSSSYGTPFTGQYKTFHITYGDGNTRTLYGTSIPAHIYPAPGTYTVGLRIYSRDTTTLSVVCTDTATISVTVIQPPCGTIISSSGAAATKSFSVSNPAGTSGISYSWSFGDGGTATGSSPVHTYASSGAYTVTCVSSVGSPVSCTYTNTITAYAVVPPPPLACSTLHANFTATVGGGGSNVGVSNSSTAPTFPYVSTATWYWGDGTFSLGWNPLPHAYTATGTYTIMLVAEWSDSMKTTACRDSITKNVTITSLSPASITGYITYDTATYNQDTFKVWLIQFDPATNILSAVDSQIVSVTSGQYYSFNNKPAGNYLVKAAPHNGPVSGTGLIPTYHYSSALWSTATTVNALAGTSKFAYIYVLAGTVTSGPGFVGGNVSLGANKGSSGGVPGMMIVLRDAALRVVQIATTDANGDFSFSNIPAGSYTVYPEQMNYATTPAAITVTNGSSTVTGINFHQDDMKMNIKPHELAVNGISANRASWSIYPNPAGRTLNISWTNAVVSGSGIIIMDVAGKTVMQVPLQAVQNGRQMIDISALRQGLYFVQGAGALQGGQKLVVE